MSNVATDIDHPKDTVSRVSKRWMEESTLTCKPKNGRLFKLTKRADHVLVNHQQVYTTFVWNFKEIKKKKKKNTARKLFVRSDK